MTHDSATMRALQDISRPVSTDELFRQAEARHALTERLKAERAEQIALIVDKLRYHGQVVDATFIAPDEKPGLAETPAELLRMIWPALAIFALFVLPFVAGALAWRAM